MLFLYSAISNELRNSPKAECKDFKRRTGVYKQTFKRMLHAWQTYHLSRSNAGRPPKLCRCDQLLVALQYWREYRTYFHIAGDWEVSESTVCRIVHQVETALMNSGTLSLTRPEIFATRV